MFDASSDLFDVQLLFDAQIDLKVTWLPMPLWEEELGKLHPYSARFEKQGFPEQKKIYRGGESQRINFCNRIWVSGSRSWFIQIWFKG